MSDLPPSPSQLEQTLQEDELLDPRVSLHWERCRDYPILSDYNSSVFLNGKLYLGGYNYFQSDCQMLVYTPSEDSWNSISTPTNNYNLATYRSQLVLIDRVPVSQSLPTRFWLFTDNHWVPHPTISSLQADNSVLCAVGFGINLIVAVNTIKPGRFFIPPLNRQLAIRVFNGFNWCKLQIESPLLSSDGPCHFCLHDDDCYFSCKNTIIHIPLKSLIASALDSGAPSLGINKHRVQHTILPTVPIDDHQTVWFGSCLLAIGGGKVYAYNHQARKWEFISSVPAGASFGMCCAALPTAELLVIGGYQYPGANRVLKATLEVNSDPTLTRPTEQASSSKEEPIITSPHSLEPATVVPPEPKDPAVAAEARIVLKHAVPAEPSESQKTTSELLHSLEQAVAEFGHKRSKIKVQAAMETLAALKGRLGAMESQTEGSKHQPIEGMPTHSLLKAEVLESMTKSEPFSKVDTSVDPITKVFDFLEETVHQFKNALGSQAPLMLEALSAAREQSSECLLRFSKSLELLKGLEHENAMLKYKLMELSVPSTEELSDTRQLHVVKTEYPVKREIKQEVIPETKPLRPISIAEPTSAPPTTTELRGVETIAETFLRVTKSGNSFHWAGYGLKVTFPADCLPPGVEECLLRIQVSLSGQYTFPGKTTLVSAVYWFKCKPRITFTKPFTLEIQNCAKPDNFSKLKFYRASSSQHECPYSFQPLQNGVFASHSSYGFIQLDRFCGIAVGQEGTDESNCCASLFYLGDSKTKKQIDLVINLDLEACITAVLEEYAVRKALFESGITIEFEHEQISLEIGEGIEQDGWRLTALDPPCVERRQVESFKPGKILPRCKLLLKYCGSDPPPEFQHRLVMAGAKKPKDYITILSDLISPVTASESLTIRRRRQRESHTESAVLRGKHKLLEERSAAISELQVVKKAKLEATTDTPLLALPPANTTSSLHPLFPASYQLSSAAPHYPYLPSTSLLQHAYASPFSMTPANPLTVGSLLPIAYQNQRTVDPSLVSQLPPHLTAIISKNDLNELSEILMEIAGSWEVFLFSLGLSGNERDQIKAQHAQSSYSATLCLLDVLERWFKLRDSPTYGDILQALQGNFINNKRLAYQIEQLALTKLELKASQVEPQVLEDGGESQHSN